MPDKFKIENERANNNNDRNGEQWEKLLGNGKTINVLQSQLPVPRMETRRRSENSLLSSFQKNLRMSIGGGWKDEHGHVFSRSVNSTSTSSSSSSFFFCFYLFCFCHHHHHLKFNVLN